MKRTENHGLRGQGRPQVYTAPEAWQGTIERLAWGGLGVGRAEDGRVVLLSAPLALFPGETVRAAVRWKARHGEGEVEAWLSRDPRRGPAGCPAAQDCGGCELREGEACASSLKRAMVEDLLARQLPGAPPFRWLEAPGDARRHRIQLHWDGRNLGFHGRRSHRLVPVSACPAAAPCLSEALPALSEALRSGALPPRPQRWELATGTPADTVFAVLPDGRAWRLEGGEWSPTREPITHRQGSIRLQHRPGSFFQVCAPLAMEAFGRVLEGWDLRGETLYDLYGGVGLFSALLGERFRHRILVEGNADAVQSARANLEAMDLPATCVAEAVEAWMPERLGAAGDLLLLDPPRTGLDAGLSARLLGARASALVLIGCDGAAFCRDVKRLSPAWRLEDLAVLDLFPLTRHVECVGLFRPVQP